MDFASMDLNNNGWEKARENFSESSKQQNLNLLHLGNDLHDICILFTTIYISFTLY